MSTNGYEIRLELLKMAKEMLEQDWHAQREVAMATYSTQVSFAHAMAEKASLQQITLPPQPTLKPFPTESEIIQKAKTLNEFINQRT